MTGKARPGGGTLRVAGHGLLHEGWPYTDSGTQQYQRGHSGRGRCECGAMSESVETVAARKRWHREHKEAVIRRDGEP